MEHGQSYSGLFLTDYKTYIVVETPDQKVYSKRLGVVTVEFNDHTGDVERETGPKRLNDYAIGSMIGFMLATGAYEFEAGAIEPTLSTGIFSAKIYATQNAGANTFSFLIDVQRSALPTRPY